MQNENKSWITCFFSVHARMEDLDEDSMYFLLKSGLLSRLNFKHKLNSAHTEENTEKRQLIFHTKNVFNSRLLRFWSAIEPAIIGELSQPWSYEPDFLMFDYNIEKYLDNMGLSNHYLSQKSSIAK